MILVAQHYRGPRFFVPRYLRPEKYDYYRRIPMTPVVADRDQDCAICMVRSIPWNAGGVFHGMQECVECGGRVSWSAG